MPQYISDAKFVYAPFLEVAIGTADGLMRYGRLEENSEIAITPVFAKRGINQRLLGSTVEIKALDVEGTHDLRKKYLPLINTEVLPYFNCESGVLYIGPMTYTFGMEHIAQRGLRFVHRFTGFSYMPEWLTFLDSGWAAFQKAVFGSSSKGVLDKGGGK